jgi:teichuronic acid biosynthesis glycosyltransferase TuaG
MEHADSHEDYILWLKILQVHGFACGINEPLLRYRLSNTGKSGSKLKSAKMTFMVYRYMGFGLPKSILCFCSYALHGVRKYLFARKRGSTTP